RRAVALLEAARAIVREHGGRVPRDPVALRALPGVGPYTASAVASIGHGVPLAAADTNVRRVLARVVHGADAAAVPDHELAADAERWLDRSAPADWNQALMDLGRVVCRPAPRCDACPLARACRFRRSGATPGPPARRQSPFEGSGRQVRGAVLRALRRRRSMTRAQLAAAILDHGAEAARLDAALATLARDHLVERTRAGRYRLPADPRPR
ncbi:MAG TPA: A/G-specific adenine glycosylase, partial [Actinomycetota bacterium]|nr:A/G-specific adenine glycosylase [Actinomycetota bacterium]